MINAHPVDIQRFLVFLQDIQISESFRNGFIKPYTGLSKELQLSIYALLLGGNMEIWSRFLALVCAFLNSATSGYLKFLVRFHFPLSPAWSQEIIDADFEKQDCLLSLNSFGTVEVGSKACPLKRVQRTSAYWNGKPRYIVKSRSQEILVRLMDVLAHPIVRLVLWSGQIHRKVVVGLGCRRGNYCLVGVVIGSFWALLIQISCHMAVNWHF